MSRLLTHAEVCGITGREDPLIDADIRFAVHTAYSPWRAKAALTGRPDARESDWGCAGRYDHRHLVCGSDGRGLWVRVIDYSSDRRAERAGHIPWRTAEAVLKEREAGQQSLF